MIRRIGLVVLPLLFISIATGPAALAAEFPDRAITLIAPYAPGGVTDLGARVLAEAMEKHLKKAVLVVNRPGGSTTIGGNVVATAKPDGYTLGAFASSAAFPEIYTYFYEAPYSNKDLRPVARIGAPVLTITVKGDSPISSVKDLVEYARKNPGAKMAIHGKSTTGYLAMKTIAKQDNVTFVDVPFDGDTKIVPAILGGHVPAGTPAYPGIAALLEAKQVKIIALLIEKRAEFAPSIPTLVELGYKLPSGSFFGIFAPKGAPDPAIRKISDVMAKVSQEKDYRDKMHKMGTQVLFEDTKAFEKTVNLYKENLRAFFKEEGLVK